MKEMKYYDGTKLLSLKDINGNTPEIFLSTANRSVGKTTYFNRLVLRKYLRGDGKFCLVYRFVYELEDCASKFFKDIHGLFFSEYQMTAIKRCKGVYYELFLDDKSCGYAVALNNADQVKKVSHLMSDCCCMLMDEFQSETNHYCDSEVDKLISIHTSLARGQGQQVKYLPLYMLSNTVSLLNPYYVSLGICNRLQKDTQYLKGDGFVLEQTYMEEVGMAQMATGFNRAFATNKYVAYAGQNVYLNDNTSFIEKPEGNAKYLATLKYKDKHYALRQYTDLGILYVDNRPDMSNPNRLSITTEDHNINYVMLKSNDLFMNQLRYYFNRGCFRFKDLQCKECILTALSY